MDFRFTSEHRPSEIGNIIKFLSGSRLWVPSTDYPGHQNWLDKAYEEMRSGVKQPISADYNGCRAGAIVIQAHKQILRYGEIRNVTLDPSVWGRHVAQFLVINAEFLSAELFGSEYMIADAKATNRHIRRLLLSLGYEIMGVSDLYTWGRPDITYVKKIRHRK